MVSQILPETIWAFEIMGIEVVVTETVVTTWVIIVLLAFGSFVLTRNCSIWKPSSAQHLAERIVIAIENSLKNDVNLSAWKLVPLIGTLWIFIAAMNLVSIIPYFHNPTSDLGTTASLAVIVFGSIHYFGIRFAGCSRYFRRYIEPSVLLLPFNLFSDVSRIFAMAIRLFGNMLSWELIVAILIALAGFLVPVPIMLLSIVGDLLHAYLFGLLAYIFIIGGIEAEHIIPQEE